MCIHTHAPARARARTHTHTHTHMYVLLTLSKAYEIPLVVKIFVKISVLYSSVKDENLIAHEIKMWSKK